jgi:hypothetical protein
VKFASSPYSCFILTSQILQASMLCSTTVAICTEVGKIWKDVRHLKSGIFTQISCSVLCLASES